MLTGVSFDKNHKKRGEQIEELLLDATGQKVSLDETYFLGNKEPKPVVITFASMADKISVFENKSELANFEGENGSSIFLNDYWPASVNEKKRREREVKKEAKQDNKDVKIEYTEKGLKIGSEIYKKKVTAPSPTDVLDITSDRLNSILELDIIRGIPIKLEDSIFIAYTTDVSTHAQIRDLYLKIRLMHAHARHIVCAYYIPGSRHHHQDYEDDSENGAGRILLRFMQKNNLSHRVLFVVRFCGQVKLKENRFSSYLKAVDEVLKLNNYNATLKICQDFTTKIEDKAKERPKSSKHSAGSRRGGSRGGFGGSQGYSTGRGQHGNAGSYTQSYRKVFKKKANDDLD